MIGKVRVQLIQEGFRTIIKTINKNGNKITFVVWGPLKSLFYFDFIIYFKSE